MQTERTPLRVGNPRRAHHKSHALGRTGFDLRSVASTWDREKNTFASAESGLGGEIRVEIRINAEFADEYFLALEEQEQETEQEIGEPLVWLRPENTHTRRIQLRSPADVRDVRDWERQHQWLKEKAERFLEVLGPRIRSLDIDALGGLGSGGLDAPEALGT